MLRQCLRLPLDATRAGQALFPPLPNLLCLSKSCYRGGSAAFPEKGDKGRERGETHASIPPPRKAKALLLRQTINGTRRDVLVRERGFEVQDTSTARRLGDESAGARCIPQSEREERDPTHRHRHQGHPWLFCSTTGGFGSRVRSNVTEAFLPREYPKSVSKGYLEFVGWQGAHIAAQSASTVLSSSFLLYAVGLGSGSIPVAGALNWVLKDGLGQLGTLVVSKRLAHTFDQHSKAWNVLAALQLDVAICLEVLTFSFPTHFLTLGAFANAMKGVAWMASSSTKAVFHLSFAKSSNLADITAKSVAQSILFNLLGTCLGMGICSAIGQDTRLALGFLAMLSSVHLYACWKATKCVPISRLSLDRLERILVGIPPPQEGRGRELRLPEPFDLAQREVFLDHFTSLFGTKRSSRTASSTRRRTHDDWLDHHPPGTFEIRTTAIQDEEKEGCLATKYFHSNPEGLFELLKSYQDAKHLLFVHNKQVYLTLHESLCKSESSTADDLDPSSSLLKAYVHAVMLRNRLAESQSNIVQAETETESEKNDGNNETVDGTDALMPLSELARTYPKVVQQLKESGWDVQHPVLERSLGRARW